MTSTYYLQRKYLPMLLTMLEVRNIMSESINLVTELHNQSLVKRVYKRVKYLQKKNFENGLDQINDENDQFSSNWVKSDFCFQWTLTTLHLE